jgi:hypothetical protein
VKAPFQMLFISRLAKVANDPIVQGAGALNIIGEGSHEDCRNRVPCIAEVPVEFDAGHVIMPPTMLLLTIAAGGL